MPDEVLNFTVRFADDFYEKLDKAILDTAKFIEDKLSSMGIKLEDVPGRGYCVISGNITTYYFDDIPIVERRIETEGNTIKFSARSL